MPIICVYPKEAVEQLGEHVKVMTNPLYFEGLVVFRWFSKAGITASTKLPLELGLPANIMAFSTDLPNSPVMWREAVRFDATGVLDKTEATRWYPDPGLHDAYREKLKSTFLLHSAVDLYMYANALTGPNFLPEQLENGKRYLLRKYLTD